MEVGDDGGSRGGVRPNKGETIGRLLDAGRREFAYHGLAGANVEAIARGAGVTKQLLYQYFTSKQALFAAVLDQAAEGMAASFLALDFDDMPPVVALRRFCEAVFDQYACDPLLARLAREGMGYRNRPPPAGAAPVVMAPVVNAKLDAILHRGMASGELREGLEAPACMAVVTLMMTGGFTHRYPISLMLGVSSVSDEGMALWREAAAGFVVAAFARGREAP